MRDRIRDEFLKQISIASVSGKEEEFGQYMSGRLKELGLTVSSDKLGNIFARLPGRSERRSVLFSAHLDTVPTGPIRAEIDGDMIRASGSAILGADDKAATSAIIECLTILKESPFEHGDLEILLTIKEETGLDGAKGFDLKIPKAEFYFVFDYSEPVGLAVKSAPYANSFIGKFTGKAAHAGGEPEKGISAIQAMALAISQMPLGRIDLETTANIGLVSGGSATNIIPPYAEMKGEARSRNLAKLDRQTQTMMEISEEAAVSIGAKAETEVQREYQGYSLEENDPIIQLARKAMREIQIELQLVDAGGASDANIFMERGKKSLVLSCGYFDAHTPQEAVSISEMEKLSQFMLALLKVA